METVFAGRDAVQPFGGLIPPINLVALASLPLGMARLDAMAKRVPLDEPWTARRAKAWDARRAAHWIDTATVPARDGQGLLAAAVRGCGRPSAASTGRGERDRNRVARQQHRRRDPIL